MGNCICVTEKTTTTSCSGDDDSCESFNKKTRRRRRRRRSTVDDEGEKLLGETSSSATSCNSSTSSCGRREIKIRMTKKELEDLMRNIGLKGLTAEEILSKLIFDGGDQTRFSTVDISNHHHPWKPALQSIPEND